jgi:AcrR family transcriptional regulator
MPDKTRTYQMKRRAETQQQTRLRITESAIALHASVGPARTSISAVAEHAGVRRSTVYRHFPDEAALFDACTAHWTAANPPPDLPGWSAVADPDERLRFALAELYGFYRRTESMLDNLFRDESRNALVQERFTAFRGYFAAARDALLAGRDVSGASHRRTQAAIGHAVAYSTWKSLARDQDLDDAAAVELVTAFVTSASEPPRTTKRRATR